MTTGERGIAPVAGGRVTVAGPGVRLSFAAAAGAAEVRACFDGVPWEATASIEVTVYRGILAIGGFDVTGCGLTLAMLIDRIRTPQSIGSTPANAVFTDGAACWIADSAGGGGTLILTRLSRERAEGRFSFCGTPRDAPGGAPDREVTDGRFLVPLL